MEIEDGIKRKGYGRKENRGRLLFLWQKLKDMRFVWLISEPTLPILLWLKAPLMGGEVAKFLATCFRVFKV